MDCAYQAKSGLAAAAAASVAAIAGPLCCVAPLVLLGAGVSAAWIARLAALEPYRWIFVAMAVGFMALARAKGANRVAFWCVGALVVAAIGYPVLIPLFY